MSLSAIAGIDDSGMEAVATTAGWLTESSSGVRHHVPELYKVFFLGQSRSFNFMRNVCFEPNSSTHCIRSTNLASDFRRLFARGFRIVFRHVRLGMPENGLRVF